MLNLATKPWGKFLAYSAFGLILNGCWDKEDDAKAIQLKLNPIQLTNYQTEPKQLYPLNLEFSGSSAPLELLQKPAQAELNGISIEPKIEGKWQWQQDNLLSFMPSQDWQTGQDYKIKLEKSALNPEKTYAKAVTEAQTVRSPAFSAEIEESEFYQDPQQIQKRQSIVQLHFSHPVDRAKLEKAVQVKLLRENQDNSQDLMANLGFKIRYDEKDLNAWISSDQVALANSTNQVIETKIDKNITALVGGNSLEEPLSVKVEVPTKFSLQQQEAEIIVVNNEKNQPIQLLKLEFNRPVKGQDLEKSLKAFLLPDNPEGWNYSKLTKQVIDKAQPLKLNWQTSEHVYQKQQHFQLDIPAQSCLYVEIDANLSAFGGYQMAKAQGDLICAPEYPSYLSFVGNGSLLALKGEGKITIASRNIQKVRLDIGRIQRDQLRHIANLNQNSFQNPDLGNLKFDDISDFSNKTFILPNNDPKQTHYLSVDLPLSNHFNHEKGIFWLKISNADEEKNPKVLKDQSHEERYYFEEEQQEEDYRLVVRTDLGIIAKQALDGSQQVFVQSIQTGSPVAQAQVQVISRNGTVLAEKLTDSSGMVKFASFEDKTQENEPVMFYVEQQDDSSFLPFDTSDRSLDFSRFNISGENFNNEQNSLNAFLFTDRGIYRAGETMHFGMISKALDWHKNLNGVPIKLEITDAVGKVQWQQSEHLTNQGLNSFDYALPANANNGQWLISAYIGKQDESIKIGSASFQVQDFQPDSLRMQTSFNQDNKLAWLSPQDLQAQVQLSNLFGTPAQQRKVSANIRVVPMSPEFAQLPDYHFYGKKQDLPLTYENELPEQITDNQGNANFKLNFSQYADNSVQMLYFEADGFEANSGRGVSQSKSVLVSGLSYLVGYRSSQDLKYLRKEGNQQIHLIAVDPSLNKIATGKLQLKLTQRKYVSVLTQQDSGAYKYESKLIETPVSEQQIEIPAQGLDFSLDTSNSGDYVLSLVNEKEQELNRISYTVVGNQDLNSNLDKNSELKLSLNKSQFNAGETIEIAIQAPYKGNGLITIERDQVYAHQWFKADTNSSLQHIQIPANFEGNGYINVQFVRDLSSNEIFTSPLSYGVVPFTVNLDQRKLDLKLEAPTELKSGENLSINLQANKASKAIVYAVNEGILQVANYKLPEPLKYFFPKYRLQVETSQILDLLLPEFSLVMQYAQTGGGILENDMMAARMKALNTNPFKRKQNAPVAFWSGIVSLEENQTQSLQYKLPQGFNGKLKIMAVAVSDDQQQIGNAENATLVRDDLILSPTAPLFLAPQDQSNISLLLSNNSQHAQDVKLQLNADPQLQLEETSKTVQLPAMSEKVLNFAVKANNQLGEAQVKIEAEYLDAQQQVQKAQSQISLSLRPLSNLQQFNQIGQLGAGKQQEMNFAQSLYKEQAQQMALISPAPLPLVQAVSGYLSNYDNYCTEQIISSAMPTLLFAQQPEYQQIFAPISQGKLEQHSHSAYQSNLQRVLELLPNRQLFDGNYGLWNDLEQDSAFLTAYVAHFILEAQAHGLKLPASWAGKDALLNRTLQALQQQSLAQEGDSLEQLRQRAYASYILARFGEVPSNALLSLRQQLASQFKAEDWQQDLIAVWLGASYQLLQQHDEANKLMAGAIQGLNQDQGEWQYGHYYDPLIKDSSAIYVLSRHFPNLLPQVEQKVLARIVENLNQQRYNSLSSAMVLLALDAYSQQHGDLSQLNIQSAGQNIGQQAGSILWAKLNEESKLSLSNQSDKPVWYLLNQQGYVQTQPTQAIKNGLEIERTFTNKEGKPINKLKLGETLYVELKIRATQQPVDNVVISDLFPAGFEAIWQQDVEEQSNAWQPTHSELREDRLVAYGTIGEQTTSLRYQLKATNQGQFQVPPAYAESMYNRAFKAQSAPQESLMVEP